MIKLFPSEETFLPQFARAAGILFEAAKALDEMAGNFTDVEVKVARIKHLEHEGDQVAHQTFNLLSRTWITPIDREDIHALVRALDDVLDFIDAAASRLVLYRVGPPSNALKAGTELIVQCAMMIQKAVAQLADLKNSKEILSACVEINRLENEADTVMNHAIAALFDSSRDAIEVIKWKEIYEIVEGATDRSEDVANVLEAIVIKAT